MFYLIRALGIWGVAVTPHSGAVTPSSRCRILGIFEFGAEFWGIFELCPNFGGFLISCSQALPSSFLCCFLCFSFSFFSPSRFWYLAALLRLKIWFFFYFFPLLFSPPSFPNAIKSGQTITARREGLEIRGSFRKYKNININILSCFGTLVALGARFVIKISTWAKKGKKGKKWGKKNLKSGKFGMWSR